MHHPNLQPNPSSYYDYQVFPFIRPAEMDTAPNTTQAHPVAIVGAGPIGLVLAILLAKQNIQVSLIESEAQVCGGSRALALTKRSMEIIEQTGVSAEFLKEALVWSEGFSFYRGQIVHHLDMPFSADDKFAPMTNLPQCNMEGILVEQARALGVDLRFQTRLNALTQGADHVALTLDTPEGEYELKAQWVVGCDGARSSVRKLQGLRFEGQSFESRFVIADFKIDIDAPTGRRCYFDPPWLPGHSVLLHKAPFGVWRLDYQVPEDVSDEVALDPQRIHKHIQAHLDYIGVSAPWKIEWTTLYKPNTLTLPSYRHNRVLFCGDAAHLLPVFGVRGMNTGVQDSINLAWKLAAVVNEQASPDILDSYSAERIADARQICQDAGRSTRMMAPPSRGYRVLQKAVLALSVNHSFPRGLLHWRTSRPIDYADSALTFKDASETQFSTGPAPGAPARNVQIGEQQFLLDCFQYSFQVLVFGDNLRALKQAYADVLELRQHGIAIQLIHLDSAPQQTSGLADIYLHDPSSHAATLWDAKEGAIYVLRPDQHVCTRWKPTSETRVKEIIQALLTAIPLQAKPI